MSFTQFLPYLIVMAGVTYLVRAIPFAMGKGKVRSRFFRSFLYYIPYAVLAAMTFPAMLMSTNLLLSAAVGAAVALILAFFKRSLLLVALASCAAVYLTELLVQIL